MVTPLIQLQKSPIFQIFLLCGLEDKAFVGHELEREREKNLEREKEGEHSGINTRRNMCERNRDREGGRREGGRGNVWREFKRTYVKNLNFFLNPSFCYGCPF